MATSLAEIGQFLDNLGIKHRVDAEHGVIYTGFMTKRYRDSSGENGLVLRIQVLEDGEYLAVIAPQVYSYKDGPHKLAVFQTCLMACWKTKMLQYEYDEEDGEIRAVIEFPLEDAKLTQRQLERVVFAIPSIVEEFDAAFRAAIDRGEIAFPDVGGTASQLLDLVRLAEGLSPKDLADLIRRIREGGAGAAAGEGPDRL